MLVEWETIKESQGLFVRRLREPIKKDGENK